MKNYKVYFGSNSQYGKMIRSESRNAKNHGEELLGYGCGGGYVDIFSPTDKPISSARCENGQWVNSGKPDIRDHQ